MRSEVSRPEGYVPVGKRHSMRLVKSSHGMTVEWLTEVYQDRKFLEPGGKVARHRPAAAVPSALRLLGAPVETVHSQGNDRRHSFPHLRLSGSPGGWRQCQASR